LWELNVLVALLVKTRHLLTLQGSQLLITSTKTTTTIITIMSLSVGFIGAGNMATAIMDGLVSTGACKPEALVCSDHYEPSLEKARAKGVTGTKDNAKVCEIAKSAILIAVKPNVVPQVCADISAAPGDACIISIAAGVSLETLESHLVGRRVVRVMPNTPCLVGEGAAGFALGKLATAEDRALVKTIFGSCGIADEVPEILLNAVTGVSGSGPAYVFQFIEAMADGGVRSGLPRDVAMKLAAQTVKGAAEMVLKTGMHPGALKDMVTSPGGTTIAGVEALEKGGLRTTVISAVVASSKRSMQLGGISEEEIRYKYNLE
jgi:pyrroline-5-carboxylate reductase